MLNIDMDGVLCDFVGQCCKYFNLDPTIYENFPGEFDITKVFNIEPSIFWKKLENDSEFWSTMKWMPDGLVIFEYLVKRFGYENCIILSTPTLCPQSMVGKIQWIHKNLGYMWKRKFIFTPHKFVCAKSKSILIDDSDSNHEKFIKHGGKSILIPRIWNSRHVDRNNAYSIMIKDLENVDL